MPATPTMRKAKTKNEIRLAAIAKHKQEAHERKELELLKNPLIDLSEPTNILLPEIDFAFDKTNNLMIDNQLAKDDTDYKLENDKLKNEILTLQNRIKYLETNITNISTQLLLIIKQL